LTDSQLHFDRQLVPKPEIRLPAARDEADRLKEWALAQPVEVEPATVSELSKHLSFIAATLPSKNQDEESGRQRVAVYARLLQGFSNHALAFMSRRVCETLDWFPTPRQCLDILNQYRPPSTERELALSYVHTFGQKQFEDFIASFGRGMASDASVAAVPEQWRRIAMERGFLRLMPDGSFIIREALAPAHRLDANLDEPSDSLYVPEERDAA
jgi:hypothetical protein